MTTAPSPERLAEARTALRAWATVHARDTHTMNLVDRATGAVSSSLPAATLAQTILDVLADNEPRRSAGLAARHTVLLAELGRRTPWLPDPDRLAGLSAPALTWLGERIATLDADATRAYQSGEGIDDFLARAAEHLHDHRALDDRETDAMLRLYADAIEAWTAATHERERATSPYRHQLPPRAAEITGGSPE